MYHPYQNSLISLNSIAIQQGHPQQYTTLLKRPTALQSGGIRNTKSSTQQHHHLQTTTSSNTRERSFWRFCAPLPYWGWQVQYPSMCSLGLLMNGRQSLRSLATATWWCYRLKLARGNQQGRNCFSILFDKIHKRTQHECSRK